MFDNLRKQFKYWWQNKKNKVYDQFITELRLFTNQNADNPTMDKRIWSLYYFLSQHSDYDSLIITLNRFIRAKKDYTDAENMLIKVLLFKLEAPLFWLNRVFYPVKSDQI